MEDERIVRTAHDSQPVDKYLAFQEKERKLGKILDSHYPQQLNNDDIIDLAADAAELDPDMEEVIMDVASLFKPGATWELNMPIEEASKILDKNTSIVNQELKTKRKRGTPASRFIYFVNAFFAKIANY